MSQKDEAGVEREQISLSAVYHQLDDHLDSDDAPYDVGAGLERLVSWMSEERPASQVGSSVEYLEAERLVRNRELIDLRVRVIERTASARMRSSLIATGTVAFLSLLAGLGLLFGLPLVPAHAAVPIGVTIGVIDALIAFAVGYIHRTTMKTLQGDLQLFFGTRIKPRKEDGGKGGKAAEPTRQPRAAIPPVEVVPSKTSFKLRSVLAAIFVGAGIAVTWLPYATRNWIPLIGAGIVLAGILALLVAVIIPAVWSKESVRRDAAQRVFYAMLGLTVRSNAPATSQGRTQGVGGRTRKHRGARVGHGAAHGDEGPRADT